MSSGRSASAITSLPKPGALAPAGVGRSRPATAGAAALVLARAVADWDGVMAGISSGLGRWGEVGCGWCFVVCGGGGGGVGGPHSQLNCEPLRNRAGGHDIAVGRITRVS